MKKDPKVFVEDQAEETRKVYLAGYGQGLKEASGLLSAAKRVSAWKPRGYIGNYNQEMLDDLTELYSAIAKFEARGLE